MLAKRSFRNRASYKFLNSKHRN